MDMRILRRVMATDEDLALTVIRILLGFLFFAHGAQKMLGWYGGNGFTNTMRGFESQGIPAVFAFLAIAAEFFGGIGLITGVLGRIAAFGIFCTMVVAIVKVHAGNGLFMNWTGRNKGEGYEYHLLVVAITVAIMLKGSGAYSVDHAVSRETSGHSGTV